MKTAVAYLVGLLFGLGLCVGGMTDPARVLGFLDLADAWDPSLMFVMAGALVVTALGYRLVFARGRPWLAANFELPTASRIDRRLLLGAALFGIGWGLAGYCPGPALTSLAGMRPAVWGLVASMVLGWWLASRLRLGSQR
jgi:uncharacterized membrane protein YedE/YeeE